METYTNKTYVYLQLWVIKKANSIVRKKTNKKVCDKNGLYINIVVLKNKVNPGPSQTKDFKLVVVADVNDLMVIIMI